MPRKSKKKGDYGLKPFEIVAGDNRHLRMGLSMTESEAWQELTSNSVRVYLEFKVKYAESGNKNENNISFTYTEGKKKMNARTFTKCIDQLIDFGFITVQQNWALRKPNIYAFSDQWKYYGTKHFTVKPRRSRKPAAIDEISGESEHERALELVAASVEK